MRPPVSPPAGLDLRLVPAAVTAWFVTAAGVLWGTLAALSVLAVAGIATVGLGVLLNRWALSPGASGPGATWPGALAVTAVGLGFTVAIGLRVHDVDHHAIAARYGSTSTVTVTPSESPRYLRGSRMMFRASLDVLDGAETSGRVLVFATQHEFDDLIAGRPATFRTGVGRPTRSDLTVAVLTAAGRPTLGRAPGWQRVAAGLRADFAAAARAVLPADGAALLPALVLGDTAAVSPQATADFRAAGLTHLTAVSGANVTIVCGTVLLSAVLLGPRIAVAAAGLALVAFVAVVQPSASVLRAAVMGAITLFAIVSRRRRQAVPALSASVLTLMIVAPELAVDLGFLLSVTATAALIVVAPVWSRRLGERGWPKPLADAVAVTLAAQAVTAPIIAGISGTFSLMSLFANLTVAVVIPPITVLGTAAAAITSPWPDAAGVLIRFTGPEVWWLSHVARWSAAIPGATAPVPSGPAGVVGVAAAVLAAAVAWRWRRTRLAVVVAVLCLFAWAAGQGAGHVGST